MIPIRLPSLAQRREDIRPLALHFLNRTNQANQRNIYLSAAALEALEAQPWPGNIRELANVIERLVLLTDGTLVSKADVARFLPPAAALQAPTARSAEPPAEPIDAPLVRDYRDRHSHSAQALRDALARHGGNQSRAAQSLGLTPRQFGYRWRKLQPGA